MTAFARFATATGMALSAAVLLSSCSSAPAPPQKGTPGFYWSAARETFVAGDYLKTIEHLDKIASSENEYTARARPWLLVMTAGMSRGYASLADAFEAGARANKSDPAAFRRLTSTYRGTAGRLSLQFAEAFQNFQKNQPEQVPLAFPFPTGNTAPVALLSKAANGILPDSAEIETAQKRAVSREILLETCRAAGAPENPPKAEELFKSGNVQVPKATFLRAMTESMYEGSQLYSPRKLDDPEKLKIFSSRALEAVKMLPDSKETTELRKKIEASLKKK